MLIVIDMQGAQSTGSRNRGIGRYTLALTKEMARQRREHEIILVLNGLFPDTIEHIRATFSDLLPQENIRVWESAGPVNSQDTANDARRKAAEISREAFLASLQPDVVLNTSLFEGLVDDSITSIGTFTTALPTAVILYDLIPLIHRGVYLQSPLVERWYMNKLDHLRRADLLLSISASSGREAIEYLGVPSTDVVNISTACDNQFQRIVIDEALPSHVDKTYGLFKPFVMYTGGIDHRKNIEGLIRAYASLPQHVRAKHQLVVVCAIQPPDRERLQLLADMEGLAPDELIMTGFVSEKDLLALYNACKLFVFPSWHEGFGLPALEAMACGRAVIGANTSSIPEVIAREDALFDPFDDVDIARKLLQVLTDDEFRTELERHGIAQAQNFSWVNTARLAWDGLEALASKKKAFVQVAYQTHKPRRPRLAYFSPLPPEHSGISDYSAELLPELAIHYEIEVIVTQNEVTDAWVLANCPVRDVTWFRQHAHCFDRVMYHFGNSDFHGHMFDLLGEFPGIVVMHDFFLSGILANMHFQGVKPNGWARALIHSHGWAALQAYDKAKNSAKETSDVADAYPCNLEVIEQALGVIVHSKHSCQLAKYWFGPGVANDWTVVSLLRAKAVAPNRQAARRNLGQAERDFLVCSFGGLGPTKLNQRLLSAWLASPMAQDPHCVLVFVGQNHGEDYGVQLVRTIRGSPTASRIEITGWTDAKNYKQWLEAADVGVQLRTLSRGETSAAVLDCMNFGLATIVNANGSMADLPEYAVWMLPDEFQDEELIAAMTTLWKSPDRRTALGEQAREFLNSNHQPRICAAQYTEAIERYYQRATYRLPALFDALSQVTPPLSAQDKFRVSSALSNNFPSHPRRRQLLLDVSIIAQGDARSGIQRVVRSLLKEFMLNPPIGWVVAPVCATAEIEGYRYARRFANQFLGIEQNWAEDSSVEAYPGDMLIGLDLQHGVLPLQKRYLNGLRGRGVAIYFIVYDLLPVLQPNAFPDGTEIRHQEWLKTLSEFDGAMCISRAVADELYDWLQFFGPDRERPFSLDWFHLGADVENSMPTLGMPTGSTEVLSVLSSRPSFLMVGTIEPRKGQGQTLAAFELLWSQSIDINLVVVGKQGWKVEWLTEKYLNHPEVNKRLFWLDGISDEYLEKLYATCSCLIAASEGEGFGLPLIEAAQHKLPIIARDIPVFREIAGDFALFFPNEKDPEVIATAIQEWLSLHRAGAHPRSNAMPWLTWKASANQLLKSVLNVAPYKTWLPDDTKRYCGSDKRMHTQVGERSGQAMHTTGTAGLLVFGPYASVSAGAYQMQLKGKAYTSTTNCWLDVSCKAGTQRLLYEELPEPNAQGDWSVTTNLLLDSSVEDLEIRVWVSAVTVLNLMSIVLVPSLATKNLPEIGQITPNGSVELIEQPTATVDTVEPFRKKTKKNKRR